MRADKMFEKLGWHKTDRMFTKCSYFQIYGYYENEKDLEEDIKKEGKLLLLFIDFQNIVDNSINISLELCDASMNGGEIKISMVGERQELPRLGLLAEVDLIKAINRKIYELGW